MQSGLEQVTAFFESAVFEAGFLTLLVLELAALVSVPSVLLSRRGRPTVALAWLLMLFAAPAIGVLAWWALGRTRFARKRRAHFRVRRDVAEKVGAPSTTPGTRFDRLLPGRALGEYAFSTAGTRVELLADGEVAFAELEKAISEAQECVHLLFYIFKDDSTGQRIGNLLGQCAERGVEVLLLLDGFGCRTTAHKLKKALAPRGVRVEVFMPTRFWPLTPRMNFVNHRKIVTIDHSIAFVGGMNIGHEYESDWRDLMLRLQGPAVEGLSHVFLEDWFFATREQLKDPRDTSTTQDGALSDVGIVSSGPDTEAWIHDAYFLAVTQAERRIYLVTPYFIPTQAISTALRTAAGRGVDVRIVLPSLSDVRLVKWASRSFYRALIEAGVRIYEYSGAMLHAKALIKDDDIVSVGSANIDNRSFQLNFEVCCFVESPAVTQELSTWVEALLVQSTEITRAKLNEKGTARKLLESAAHLASPLL